MVQFIFLKCNWRKGAKSIPKANLRCNFKLRVDFQESDKYLQRTRAHVRSSVLRWLGHLENSTASQPPTELRTRICTTRIKLLRTGLGPEVWGDSGCTMHILVCTWFIPVHPVSYHDHAFPFSAQSISLRNAISTRLYSLCNRYQSAVHTSRIYIHLESRHHG